jgi:hypothetical protein
MLTKAPLLKQGQRRNPLLATPRAKMRSVLRLILPGGELLAAPWALRVPAIGLATAQAPGAPGGELLATPSALRVPAIGLATAGATPLQRSRNAKTADRKTTKAIKGQLLPIGSRTATVTHTATTSVAQIEFVASQNRQEVTKLDENEADAATEIRLCNALDKKPLKYRLPLIVVLMPLNESASRSTQPRSQAK